jgi:uncharacterized OB-fold protein
MSNDITRRCSKCGKHYFVYNEDYKCPHCGHNPNNDFNPFKDIFGDDNPFNGLGAT